MSGPYEILGVPRDATEDDIRKAYRKLAKQHHPDLNPGNAQAEERFKEIASAYALLSDPDKRGRFDRGEIDANSAETGQDRQFYRDYAEQAGRSKYHAGPSVDPDDLGDFFASAFGGARGFGGAGSAGFGNFRPEPRYSLTVDFLDAANGAVKRLTLPTGRTLDVTIPAGLQDGQILRLRNKALTDYSEILIEVGVAPHPLFKRDGNDVLIDLPVTVKEAVLGAKVQVPTIKGPVNLTIPANSSTGARLRLKGRGIAPDQQPAGHQYVTLNIVLPPHAEPELAAFLENWQPSRSFDPRAGMEAK